MIMSLMKFFDDLGIRKPDYFLSSAGKSSSETIGNVIVKTDQLLEKTNPDAFLVLGDTNSCMAILPAKEEKYPHFIWRQEIDVLICEFLRKSIEG